MEPDVSAKLTNFFSQFPLRSYPKGQILIFAGEDPEHIYHIVTGKVREYGISYRGDEIIVNIFKAPAFFPMSYALNRAENRFFFKTEESTEVHAVPVDAALQFLKDNPDVTLDLLSRVYRGVDGIFERMVQLMAGSAKSRVIHELIIESQRFGVKEGKLYKLSINEFDLAARAGLSRETVSREMQKLKDAGLVSLHNKIIIVDDYAALETLLAKS